MIFSSSPPSCFASFAPGLDCQSTLDRLIGNISGFVYRRRHDAAWTMEFISAGCRDLTGYDPHRFIANESMAFADLIGRPDRDRVNKLIRSAVQHRHRTTVYYLIRAAHGLWVQVEDRLTPVFTAAGRIVTIEGVIDLARSPTDGDSAAQNRVREPATEHFAHAQSFS